MGLTLCSFTKQEENCAIQKLFLNPKRYHSFSGLRTLALVSNKKKNERAPAYQFCCNLRNL